MAKITRRHIQAEKASLVYTMVILKLILSLLWLRTSALGTRGNLATCSGWHCQWSIGIMRKQLWVTGLLVVYFLVSLFSTDRRTLLAVVMQSTAGDISYTAESEKCNAESAGITAARRQRWSCNYDEDRRHFKSVFWKRSFCDVRPCSKCSVFYPDIDIDSLLD